MAIMWQLQLSAVAKTLIHEEGRPYRPYRAHPIGPIRPHGPFGPCRLNGLDSKSGKEKHT